MVTAVRRLLLYLGGVCAALALVEGAFRVFAREILFALAHAGVQIDFIYFSF
jgi:hypothetical protein